MKTTPQSGSGAKMIKPQVSSAGGVVVAQHDEAARAGAAALARGGNAMDAAIVTALSLSVLEPWLSGLGGGGFLLHAAPGGGVDTLDFNVIAGEMARPADYPLIGGAGGDWFDWPAVEGDRNLIGPLSICTPGAVAGFAAALERYGTISWAEALEPAIAFAERGMRVDWFAELAFSIDRDGLEGNRAASKLFLDPARRVPDPENEAQSFLPMPSKAAMLRRLAKEGPRDFYEGETAAALLSDLSAAGAKLTARDLAGYTPEWKEPAATDYRDRKILTIDGLSGGPSLLKTLNALAAHDVGALNDAPRAALFADVIRATYAERLQTMGHAAGGGDCTSHISVTDKDGRMVSLTNTLLSRFGSKVLAPSCGLLMNNGVMWFDPRPGQPNSIAPSARPLANMSPVIALKEGAPEIALGAAGGRQIFPAVTQILSALIDRGLSPEQAMHAPRIDASTPTITVNRADAKDAAAAVSVSHPVRICEDTVYPVEFAIPSLAVSGMGRGPATGAAHPASPWAAAVAGDAMNDEGP